MDRIEHDRLLYQEESCATTIDLFLQILFYDDVTDLESDNLLNLRKKVAVLWQYSYEFGLSATINTKYDCATLFKNDPSIISHSGRIFAEVAVDFFYPPVI